MSKIPQDFTRRVRVDWTGASSKRAKIPTLLAAILVWAPALAANAPADLILFNGHLVTVDRAQPKAQAVAVRAGKIIAVGSDKEVLKLADKATRRIVVGQDPSYKP